MKASLSRFAQRARPYALSIALACADGMVRQPVHVSTRRGRALKRRVGCTVQILPLSRRQGFEHSLARQFVTKSEGFPLGA